MRIFIPFYAMRTRKIRKRKEAKIKHKGRVCVCERAFPYNMKMPLNTYYGALHPERVIFQLEWPENHGWNI